MTSEVKSIGLEEALEKVPKLVELLREVEKHENAFFGLTMDAETIAQSIRNEG